LKALNRYQDRVLRALRSNRAEVWKANGALRKEVSRLETVQDVVNEGPEEDDEPDWLKEAQAQVATYTKTITEMEVDIEELLAQIHELLSRLADSEAEQTAILASLTAAEGENAVIQAETAQVTEALRKSEQEKEIAEQELAALRQEMVDQRDIEEQIRRKQQRIDELSDMLRTEVRDRQRDQSYAEQRESTMRQEIASLRIAISLIRTARRDGKAYKAAPVLTDDDDEPPWLVEMERVLRDEQSPILEQSPEMLYGGLMEAVSNGTLDNVKRYLSAGRRAGIVNFYTGAGPDNREWNPKKVPLIHMLSDWSSERRDIRWTTIDLLEAVQSMIDGGLNLQAGGFGDKRSSFSGGYMQHLIGQNASEIYPSKFPFVFKKLLEAGAATDLGVARGGSQAELSALLSCCKYYFRAQGAQYLGDAMPPKWFTQLGLGGRQAEDLTAWKPTFLPDGWFLDTLIATHQLQKDGSAQDINTTMPNGNRGRWVCGLGLALEGIPEVFLNLGQTLVGPGQGAFNVLDYNEARENGYLPDKLPSDAPLSLRAAYAASDSYAPTGTGPPRTQEELNRRVALMVAKQDIVVRLRDDAAIDVCRRFVEEFGALVAPPIISDEKPTAWPMWRQKKLGEQAQPWHVDAAPIVIDKVHTPWLMATVGRNIALAEYILSKGGDINGRVDEHALIGIRVGRRTLASRLDTGVEGDVSIYFEKDQGIEGYTALMLACRYGHEDVVKFLLSRGADVFAFGVQLHPWVADVTKKISVIRTSQYKEWPVKLVTALMEAQEQGHDKISALLRNSGA